jgi:hypothetical protein
MRIKTEIAGNTSSDTTAVAMPPGNLCMPDFSDLEDVLSLRIAR